MTSWLAKNKGWLLTLTAAIASGPFLPGWVHLALSVVQSILG